MTNIDTSKWTDRQWKAYEMLKGINEADEAKRVKARKLTEKTPPSGWTDKDRI